MVFVLAILWLAVAWQSCQCPRPEYAYRYRVRGKALHVAMASWMMAWPRRQAGGRGYRGTPDTGNSGVLEYEFLQR